MAFKDILVYLDAHSGDQALLQLALAIARRDTAHLVGFYGFQLPDLTLPNLAIEGYAVSNVARTALVRERDTAFLVAAQIEATFREKTKLAGLTGDWEICPEKTTDIVAHVTERARYADLAVVGQANPDHPFFDKLAKLPETVMMGSGRPVLIVPYAGDTDAVGKNVLVAWSGTREGARAVGDAMPFLRSAEMVTVLSIGRTRASEGRDESLAASLTRHLARHGIRAVASHLVAKDIETGELILSQAASLGCDLIVMGGYGHSSTRELILGGVTRTILQSMTVPVLMSH
ncbi:MAG TPA: universal stress protein [Stellaceae bacterium]|nr:universal stress protein [Stellaceae bacterium]